MYALLGAAQARDETLVGLLGEPAYYGRFGFVAAAELGVAAPDPAWGPYFQVLPAHRPSASWRVPVRGAVRRDLSGREVTSTT